MMFENGREDLGSINDAQKKYPQVRAGSLEEDFRPPQAQKGV